jgi:ribose/xylose/arabinose/galactoside ABC-type transport system permease subunit
MSVENNTKTDLPAKATGGRQKRSRSETLTLIRQIWPWTFLALLVIAFTISSKTMNNVDFISVRSVQGILEYATQILLIALGETLIIIAAGIDLSVGWTLGFSSVIAAQVMRDQYAAGSAPVVVILLGIFAGLVVSIIPGLFNGFLIARVRVPPFISTLGVGGLFEGIALLRSQGYPISSQPPYLGPLGNNSLIYLWPGHAPSFLQMPAATNLDMAHITALIPNDVFITFLVTLVIWFILAKTQFGQHIYAIGGNLEAATRAGIPVKNTLIKVYVLAAFLAGIAGVIWTARFTSGAYNAGETTTLTAIAAVFIGGASMFGGEGKILGTIVGALIIATIIYGLVLLGISPFWQYVAVGVVVILAVVMDQFGRTLGK